MTIICAISDPAANKVWLGCNSGSLIGDVILPHHGTKWLRFTNWAVALSGAGVAHDILNLERAKFPNQTTDINQVITFIRASFAKNELGEAKEGSKFYDVSGLIAHSSGELYGFDNRLALSRIPDDTMWASGSGMEFALGADAALKNKGFPAEERIEIAVLTAIDLDCGCPGEPMIESLGKG